MNHPLIWELIWNAGLTSIQTPMAMTAMYNLIFIRSDDFRMVTSPYTLVKIQIES